MRRVVVLLLLSALAAVGLTACMSDDDNESAASAQNRRSAALVSTQPGNPGGYQVTLAPITKTDQAIVANSFAWGIQNSVSATGTGAGTGKATFQDLSITKSVDETSALLFQAASAGTHFPAVTVGINKAAEGSAQPYLVLKLQDAYISSYQVGGANPEVPHETLTLTFAKMTVESASLDEKAASAGAANVASWNIQTNTAK